MPFTLPTWDPDQRRLVDTAYYDAREVAERLHVSVRTVTRYTSERGVWPHILLARLPYMTDHHIGRVVELMTHDPDRLYDRDADTIPLHRRQEEPPLLGRVLTEDEIEGIQ